MRIGIDARFYGPRLGGGGLGRYVQEIIDNLQDLPNEGHTFVLFVKPEALKELKIKNHKFEIVIADFHWYGLAEQIKMPRLIRQNRIDLMHFPHWNIPLLCPVPFITTIHDLILLEDRNSARSSTRSPIMHGIKYAIFRIILENAIHNSRHIITISEYSKKSILKHFRVNPKKVTVVKNGFRPLKPEKSVDLYKLGIYEPYFLYVGNAYAHKNLLTLIHAFAQFAKDTKFVQLVIAGKRDKFSYNLEKEARRLKLDKERLRFINLPTDDEIAEMYKRSDLFIFPSLIEGFGIPPLEALYYKTPVAAAHTTSIPEVLQDKAEYFEPYDIEALIRIMDTAVNHPQTLQKKTKQIDEFLVQYSWKEAAKQTQNVYLEVGRSL